MAKDAEQLNRIMTGLKCSEAEAADMAERVAARWSRKCMPPRV